MGSVEYTYRCRNVLHNVTYNQGHQQQAGIPLTLRCLIIGCQSSLKGQPTHQTAQQSSNLD